MEFNMARMAMAQRQIRAQVSGLKTTVELNAVDFGGALKETRQTMNMVRDEILGAIADKRLRIQYLKYAEYKIRIRFAIG